MSVILNERMLKEGFQLLLCTSRFADEVAITLEFCEMKKNDDRRTSEIRDEPMLKHRRHNRLRLFN